MAKGKPSPRQLAEIRAFAAEWGKIVARRLGPESNGLDFAAMEQIAAAAAAGLTEGTLGVLVNQQAQTLGANHPCPDCDRACPVQREDRTVTVKGGHSDPPARAGLPLSRLSPGLFPPYAPLWALTTTATAPRFCC